MTIFDCSTYVNHLVNITFRTGIFSWIFYMNEYHEIDIIPHVMHFADMIFECDVFIIEGFPIETCKDKTMWIGINADILPQIKHVLRSISSFLCFSVRKSAKLSMITPKIKFNVMIITMKKNIIS